MPLPSYIPRSDSFGNWYFGGFQMDSIVESGYGAATSINATQAEFETFLNSALGSSNWTKSGTGLSTDYYFRFANPWEPLTGTISTTSNYRFSWMGSTSNDDIRLNTALTATPVNISRNGVVLGSFFNNANCPFVVANAYGMWISHATKGTNAGELDTAVGGSMYLGWVKDPVFPTNTNERIRNCVIGQGQNNGFSSFLCSRSENSTTSGLVSVNNPITCQVSTPGANVTDAIAIDTNSSNLALGRLHNCLILPTSLTIGRLYRIPPASDPDGNTQQNIWLCVSRNHFAFDGTTSALGTQSRLIRVWSNNIT